MTSKLSVNVVGSHFVLPKKTTTKYVPVAQLRLYWIWLNLIKEFRVLLLLTITFLKFCE